MNFSTQRKRQERMMVVKDGRAVKVSEDWRQKAFKWWNQTNRLTETTHRALVRLLKKRSLYGRRYIKESLTQLGSEQMKQCESQGERRSRESGRRVCVNVVLICRAIKRVKGSRWAASIPSVSANELARFTASTLRQPAAETLHSRSVDYPPK